MVSKLSSSGISFEILANSSTFLKEIINNITSCILLFDNKMMLQAFNEPMKTIFSNKKNEDLLYQRCGEAIGCAYAIEEEKSCGKTSQCNFCSLREAAMMTYLHKKQIYKQNLDREFYTADGTKIMKHLQFSTRLLVHEKENYVIVIIDDITHLVNQAKLISLQQDKITELMKYN